MSLSIEFDPHKYYLCAIRVEDKVIYDVVRFGGICAYTHSGYTYNPNDIVENFGEYSDIPKPEE